MQQSKHLASAANSTKLAELLNQCDGIEVSTDPAILQSHGVDWTRFRTPSPLAVAFPRTTAEVVTLVKIAAQHRIALVPSGGRTGLSGGAIADRAELVVSFDRMRAILDFNPVDR